MELASKLGDMVVLFIGVVAALASIQEIAKVGHLEENL